MEKIIHIHAKCKSFETFEQIPENKAVERLTDIRDGFLLMLYNNNNDDKLIVNTRLVNPEFDFKYQ